MAYGNFKYIKGRTASDKILRDTAFNIGYQRGIASMVYKFFDKKSEGSRIFNNKENIQLAEKLHKPIIKKFK